MNHFCQLTWNKNFRSFVNGLPSKSTWHCLFEMVQFHLNQSLINLNQSSLIYACFSPQQTSGTKSGINSQPSHLFRLFITNPKRITHDWWFSVSLSPSAIPSMEDILTACPDESIVSAEILVQLLRIQSSKWPHTQIKYIRRSRECQIE